MKLSLKKTAYIVSFLALSSIFALLYYAGYYYAANYMKSDNLITKEDAAGMNPGINKSTEDAAEVGSPAEQTITSKTGYIEESYNSDTGELTKTEKNVPVDLIGLNRNQVIDYLTTYKERNTDKSLINIQLVSFSAESLVIRKTVCSIEELYSYYVISESDIIKIYNANRDTLFLDTGIDISHFEEEYKEELNEGFYIETIHDLYKYLESITS